MTKFTVKRLKQRDVGKQIARLDPEYMEEKDIKGGDFIKIINPKKDEKEIVKVVPGYKQDYGQRNIRIQGTTRRSLNTRVDETVNIEKVNEENIQIANKVTLITNKVIKTDNPEVFRSKIKEAMKENPFLEGSVFGLRLFVMGKIMFVVENIDPSGSELYLANENTEVEIGMPSRNQQQGRSPRGNKRREEMNSGLFGNNQRANQQQANQNKWEANLDTDITYEDVGGLSEELEKVRDMIELPLSYPQIFDTLGIEPPKGVLLHGPPGTGKTLLAKAVANEVDASFFKISGPEILSKFYGESEEQLREVFEEASENSPAIIFIDELDSIAPNRNEASGDVEKRVVAELLSKMDGLESRGDVIVIGATNRVDQIDPALRRGGRFDREIEIGVPDKEGRKEILQIHTRGMPLEEDVDLERIASKTHGYVGADLATLTKEAAMNVLENIKEDIDFEKEQIPSEIYENIKISKEDFKTAMREVEPSAMRELFVETPDVGYKDVGGLEEAKQKLMESIEWPLDNPEIFEKAGIEPPKGTILYGPPGTGKTLLAKAVASESETNFISIKGPEILNKYVGESEKGIRDIFKKARQNAPAVVFFDEIDAIAAERGSSTGENVSERVVSQLLTELDGIEELSEVKVIATTNRPDLLDNALLRPGRFDNLVRVSMPSKEAREEIFKIHTKNTPVSETIDIQDLVSKTEGYTGSDIESICKEATMRAIRRVYDEDGEVKVTMDDFNQAVSSISKSVQDEEIEKYKEIEENIKQKTKQEDKEGNAFI